MIASTSKGQGQSLIVSSEVFSILLPH